MNTTGVASARPPAMPLSIVMLSGLASFGWLLPNHSPPWLMFHAEAWVVGAMAPLVLWSLFFSYGLIRICPLTIAALVVATLPWAQFLCGELPFAGDAWLGSGYAGGFVVAVWAGGLWQRSRPDELIDVIVLSVGIASVVSVGIQLYQWLDLSSDGLRASVWLRGTEPRPAANLGQPNQLASLLIWGVVAALWGWLRGWIRAFVAGGLVFFLLFGLVLTQSRTGALLVFVLLGFVWGYRRLWPIRTFPWWATGFALIFVLLNAVPKWFRALLMLGGGGATADRVDEGAGVRPALWRALFDAVLEQPWIGYGFNRVRAAQVETILENPEAHGVPTAYAHNLFLDFVIWFGVPVGAVLMALCFIWVWRTLVKVRRGEDAALVLMVITMAGHAMLELPLHYAYFLIPLGLVVGVLNVQTEQSGWLSVGVRTQRLAALAVTGLFGVVCYDYFKIESDYLALRFEQRRIGLEVRPEPHSALALTQLEALIAYSRAESGKPQSPKTLNWMRDVTQTYPSMRNILHLSQALALSGRSGEAQYWLARACPLTSGVECRAGMAYWGKLQQSDPRMSAVDWPASMGASPLPR